MPPRRKAQQRAASAALANPAPIPAARPWQSIQVKSSIRTMPAHDPYFETRDGRSHPEHEIKKIQHHKGAVQANAENKQRMTPGPCSTKIQAGLAAAHWLAGMARLTLILVGFTHTVFAADTPTTAPPPITRTKSPTPTTTQNRATPTEKKAAPSTAAKNASVGNAMVQFVRNQNAAIRERQQRQAQKLRGFNRLNLTIAGNPWPMYFRQEITGRRLGTAFILGRDPWLVQTTALERALVRQLTTHGWSVLLSARGKRQPNRRNSGKAKEGPAFPGIGAILAAAPTQIKQIQPGNRILVLIGGEDIAGLQLNTLFPRQGTVTIDIDRSLRRTEPPRPTTQPVAPAKTGKPSNRTDLLAESVFLGPSPVLDIILVPPQQSMAAPWLLRKQLALTAGQHYEQWKIASPRQRGIVNLSGWSSTIARHVIGWLERRVSPPKNKGL